MDWCPPPRTSNGPWRGLYSGVVLAGVGMGLVVGQGVAAASPSDSTGASQSGDTPETEATETSETPATDDSDEVGGEDSPDTAEDDETEADLDLEAGEAGVSSEADKATGLVEVSGASDDHNATGSRQRAYAAVADDDGSPTARSAGPARRIRQISGDESVSIADEAAPDTAVEPADVTTAAITPDPAAAAATTTTSAPTRVRSLVSARPVTIENIVGDLLTWAGLRPLADDAPAPATPVSALVEYLWLAVRQNQYTWNNQRPTADVTISGPGPGGTVTGGLNAVDYDDAALAYTLASGPSYGRVVIDALGRFTYTPGAAAAGRADQFTVRIDDTSDNPFHVHGLLGLLGISRPTEVTVVVSGSTVRQDVSPAFDIDDLVSRGVEVTTDPRGAVSVIDGRFTDQVVVNAADAAVVLNALAPAFVASANFADPSAILTSEAGIGDDAERFYRFTETISGIKVLGSEIVLVTDAEGQVTSVFNYYRGLGEGFDVTPDASVDEDAEVRLIAGTAYLGAEADGQDLETLLAQSTFTKELVVYTLADDGAPSLAWRAVVRLPDTGDMSAPGATYLIDADGDAVGEIIVILSNVQPAAAVTTATDWRGASRAIAIDTRTVFWFFRTSEMVDGMRNIATYQTSYSFWGLGGPVLPGTVVTRSLFGWDRAAVSAHANTAVVYDYYKSVLGRTSFNNAGAPIVVSIRYNPKTSVLGYDNAFWDPGLKQFAFGDSGYLQASLDIVAHEFTHAVVTSIVGGGNPVLDQGEQGALNEAYADILGVLIERKGRADPGRWLVGEDSDRGVLRNLANPTSISSANQYYRARYGDRYTGSADNKGEHINSTIFSHAAYLMMTDAATSDVSDETWARVFYGSLGRLSASAKFVDGRAAVLSSAEFQGLTYAQRVAIANAFDAVEIYGAPVSSAV